MRWTSSFQFVVEKPYTRCSKLRGIRDRGASLLGQLPPSVRLVMQNTLGFRAPSEASARHGLRRYPGTRKRWSCRFTSKSSIACYAWKERSQGFSEGAENMSRSTSSCLVFAASARTFDETNCFDEQNKDRLLLCKRSDAAKRSFPSSFACSSACIVLRNANRKLLLRKSLAICRSRPSFDPDTNPCEKPSSLGGLTSLLTL